jgi:hypothetical protein
MFESAAKIRNLKIHDQPQLLAPADAGSMVPASGASLVNGQ